MLLGKQLLIKENLLGTKLLYLMFNKICDREIPHKFEDIVNLQINAWGAYFKFRRRWGGGGLFEGGVLISFFPNHGLT